MKRVPMERKVLNENDRIAAELRESFQEHGILSLNLISSPGSGKTSLLERTLERFGSDQRVAVLTGDIQTDNDAQRLAKAGFPVKQISTGGACHLDAKMVKNALADWKLEDIDLLFVENVGNLICPTSFDLGEAAKIVVVSVTEGDDKPLKYPSIFLKSDLAVLNKIDLLPHLPNDVAQLRANTLRVNPEIDVVEVSCLSGEGMESWTDWLAARRQSEEVAAGER
jgi:hydrogenase nickel incorporation protein HypB